MLLKPIIYNLNKTINIQGKLIYNIIKDVPNYKNILPFCTNSKIIDSIDNNNFNAELTISYGIFEDKYISNVYCNKNNNIYEIISTNKNNLMFSKLFSKWVIIDNNNNSEINYTIEYSFKNLVYQNISKVLIKNISKNTFNSFVNKAKEIEKSEYNKNEINIDLLMLIIKDKYIINKIMSNISICKSIDNIFKIYNYNKDIILDNKDKIKYYIKLILINN